MIKIVQYETLRCDQPVRIASIESEQLTSNPQFYIDSYKKFTQNPLSDSDALLRPINHFFTTLRYGESRQIEGFYVEALRRIVDGAENGLDVTTALKLGEWFCERMCAINFPQRIVGFVESECGFNIPDPLPPMLAAEMQFSAAWTFLREDYIKIMAISLISKMLFPLWGELIYQQARLGQDRTMRDVACMSVITPILAVDEFRSVREKLYAYIAQVVTAEANRVPTPTKFVLDDVIRACIAAIIVKRYVNVDLYTPEGNIMVYTSVSARQATQALIRIIHRRLGQ